MPLTKRMQQTIGDSSTPGRSPLAIAFRKAVRKAPGTRAGILEDWRDASKSGTALRPVGKRLRDGR